MALASYQKITRVLTGKPFGSGVDGSYSSATIPTLTKDSCSGTATSTTLTTTGSTFSNGDLLFIHQTRGTGVGQYEINMVSSGGGTTSLTLSTALQYTYTDSGASQAQAIKIPQYTDVTVQSGTWTPSSWDGNTGGILVFGCSGTLTVTGNIYANGNNGVSWNSTSFGGGATGVGFAGGNSRMSALDEQKYSGEGSAGASALQRTANGNGGGGGNVLNNFPSGGGGSHGSAGTDGGGTDGYQGVAGSTVGITGLTTLFFGGGGGSGGRDYDVTQPGTGGAGAGIIVIFAKTITIDGAIYANGGNGGSSTSANKAGAGGGGAGGSILICSNTASIGTDKIRTTGGTGGTGESNGGNGGKGRIATYYGTSLNGTISSTYYGSYTNELDTEFIESSASNFFIMF